MSRTPSTTTWVMAAPALVSGDRRRGSLGNTSAAPIASVTAIRSRSRPDRRSVRAGCAERSLGACGGALLVGSLFKESDTGQTCPHGKSDMERVDQLRAGRHPREALQRGL